MNLCLSDFGTVDPDVLKHSLPVSYSFTVLVRILHQHRLGYRSPETKNNALSGVVHIFMINDSQLDLCRRSS